MLDRSRFRPTEHYPHIWCDAPPLWNPWAQRSLVFKIDSGNVKLPVGDITVWVAFDRPSAFKPYSASAAVSSSRHRITFDDHAGWKLARRALRRSDRLLWKFESDGQYFNSIGTLTLAGRPRACHSGVQAVSSRRLRHPFFATVFAPRGRRGPVAVFERTR